MRYIFQKTNENTALQYYFILHKYICYTYLSVASIYIVYLKYLPSNLRQLPYVWFLIAEHYSCVWRMKLVRAVAVQAV